MTSKLNFHVFDRCTVGYLTAWINKKMLMLGIFIFSTYIMEVNIAWLIVYDVRLSACEKHMRNYEMPTITRHTLTYLLQLEEITIHRNDLLLQIELSGWKGHVRICSKGRFLSLFVRLQLSESQLQNRSAGLKSRGTSSRYCVHFSLFIQIIRPECSFLQRRNFLTTKLFNPFDNPN